MGRRFRTIAAGVATLAIVAGGIGIAMAGDVGTAITTAKRFTLVSTIDERRQLDFGREGASLGDQFVFSGTLRKQDGARAGRFDAHCIVTSLGGRASEQRQQCFLTSTIGTANGETEIQAGGVGRLQAEDVILSVTGGSGRFQNVRGQLTVVVRGEDRAILRYSLIP